MQRNRKWTAGFTFMEVLLVLTLMGVLLNFPEIRLSSNQEQKSTVGMVTADLRWARMNAILTNRRFQVKVYPSGFGEESGPKYRIISLGADGDTIVQRRALPQELTLYRNLNPRLIEEEEFHWTTFNPQGSAGTGTLGIKDQEGRMVQIIISNMGRIRIEEY